MSSYSLQPGLKLLDSQALPQTAVTEEVFVYPQPSSLNYANYGRPNTMLYGTAPYMAGNGAPNHLIMVDDELRPQSTSQFKKIYTNTVERGSFPWQDMGCSTPLRTMSHDPQSTRTQIQNSLFSQRYKN
jgi:hypothetical protein